jgi:cytochrome subunit of sulfide dehydrogenase
MAKLSQAYSDAEIAAMGAYFAARPPEPHAAEADKAVVKSGLKIAYKYCRTCHLDGSLWRQFHQYRAYDQECSKSCHLDYGPDKGETVPLIGGQWAEYLAFQMADFRSGRRPMSPRKAKAVKALSGDEAAAVAQFYAGLQELTR